MQSQVVDKTNFIINISRFSYDEEISVADGPEVQENSILQVKGHLSNVGLLSKHAPRGGQSEYIINFWLILVQTGFNRTTITVPPASSMSVYTTDIRQRKGIGFML